MMIILYYKRICPLLLKEAPITTTSIINRCYYNTTSSAGEVEGEPPSFSTLVIYKARGLNKYIKDNNNIDYNIINNEWTTIHSNFTKYYLKAPTQQLGAFLALLHSSYTSNTFINTNTMMIHNDIIRNNNIYNNDTIYKLLRILNDRLNDDTVDINSTAELASLLYFSIPFITKSYDILLMYDWWINSCLNRILELIKLSKATPQSIGWTIRCMGNINKVLRYNYNDELWLTLLHILTQHKNSFNISILIECLKGIEDNYTTFTNERVLLPDPLIDNTLKSISSRIMDIINDNGNVGGSGSISLDDSGIILRIWAKCRICDEKLIKVMINNIKNNICRNNTNNITPQCMVDTLYGIVKFNQQYNNTTTTGGGNIIDILALKARKKIKDFTLEQLAQFCSSLAKSRITNEVISTMVADRVVLETITRRRESSRGEDNCYINNNTTTMEMMMMMNDSTRRPPPSTVAVVAAGLPSLPLYRVINLYTAFARFKHKSDRFWRVMDNEIIRRYNNGTLLIDSNGDTVDLIELISAHAAITTTTTTTNSRVNSSSVMAGSSSSSNNNKGYNNYTPSIGDIPLSISPSTICSAITITILTIINNDNISLLKPKEALRYLIAVGKVGYRDNHALQLCLKSLRAPSAPSLNDNIHDGNDDDATTASMRMMTMLPAYATLTLTQHMQLDTALMRLGVQCDDLTDYIKTLMPKANEAGSLTKEESRGAWTNNDRFNGSRYSGKKRKLSCRKRKHIW